MIGARQLRLHIGSRVLIDALDWTAKDGECWCVIGRNGVGKSTLLRTLAGVRKAEGGDVLIDDRPLSAWPLLSLARQRAYLSQARTDAFGYSAIETVLAARHPYHAGHRWETADDHQTAMAALEAMDVVDLAQRDVRTLSGGERQRVAIAALLAQDAPLMLLDEPASALDLGHQIGLMARLSRLCREQRKTIVMAGHDLNLVHAVATHVLLLMGNGEWRAGTVDDMMTESLLGRCLGHPIQRLTHNERAVYVAAM